MLVKLLLPICLSLMMFSIGLSLSLVDFKRVFSQPKSVIVGLSLQLLALPLIAWGIVLCCQTFSSIELSIAAGLIIIAACPSGATSNIVSHLSGANSALSVTLTAFVSVITPFVLPLSLSWQLNFLSTTDSIIEIPLLKTWLQLVLVTLLPLSLGMYINKRFHQAAVKHRSMVSKLAGIALLALIILFIYKQWPQLSQQANQVFYLCLTFYLTAFLSSYWTSKYCCFDAKTSKTLAIESSIQNAGTGMFIAITVLHKPEFALLPLSYGLLMNIPSLMFILQHHWQLKRSASTP